MFYHHLSPVYYVSSRSLIENSLFRFEKGEWLQSGIPYNLTWLEANYTNANRWEPTLDFQLITDTINRIVAAKFSLAIQTEVHYDY